MSHSLSPPWKHLNFTLSLNFRQCQAVLGALPFPIPNLQASGISSEKKNWEFKPWRWGEFQIWLQNVLLQNVFPRPCILTFLETEPIVTIKSWGWRRFWGHYVQLLLPQVLLTRICICCSHSPPEPAFAPRFYLAVHTKHELYHFHFLKTRCKVSNIKASYLFCFFRLVISIEWSLSYVIFRIRCLKIAELLWIFLPSDIMSNNNDNNNYLRAWAISPGLCRVLLFFPRDLCGSDQCRVWQLLHWRSGIQVRSLNRGCCAFFGVANSPWLSPGAGRDFSLNDWDVFSSHWTKIKTNPEVNVKVPPWIINLCQISHGLIFIAELWGVWAGANFMGGVIEPCEIWLHSWLQSLHGSGTAQIQLCDLWY